MMTLPQMPPEKLALAAGAACVGLAAAWGWTQQAAFEALRREPAGVALSGENYTSGPPLPMATVARPWARPRVQSQGAGWVYEVFTPPVIYYQAATHSFSVVPPSTPAGDTMAFGLELLDVRRELYRLQLVGYVGEPGDYVGAFTSPQTPETLLARSGRRFVELGLALRRLEVRKIDVSGDPALPAYDIAALAILRDERSGTEVTLDSRMRKFTDTPLALLRTGRGSKPREVRAGDVIDDEGATYTIERVQLDPPEVAVAKRLPGQPHPETRVLKPASTAKIAAKPPPKRFDPPPSDGVATALSRP